MIEPVSLAVGGGLLLVGWLTGRVSRFHGFANGGEVNPGPNLICSCVHGFGSHEDGRKCHGSTTNWRNGAQFVDRCPCHMYDGPEPLPRVWSGPTSDGT